MVVWLITRRMIFAIVSTKADILATCPAGNACINSPQIATINPMMLNQIVLDWYHFFIIFILKLINFKNITGTVKDFRHVPLYYIFQVADLL